MGLSKTFYYRYRNISELSEDFVKSSMFYFGNRAWELEIKKNRSFLACFLMCVFEENIDPIPCEVKYEIKLLSKSNAIKTITKGPYENKFEKTGSYGSPDLIGWDTLMDPSNGYLDEDSIILGVKIMEMNNSFDESEQKIEYIGLKSAKINASMNPMLQTMFFNHQFREKIYRTLYSYNTTSDHVDLLQRIFYRLEYSLQSVENRGLLDVSEMNLDDFFVRFDAIALKSDALEMFKSKIVKRFQCEGRKGYYYGSGQEIMTNIKLSIEDNTTSKRETNLLHLH